MKRSTFDIVLEVLKSTRGPKPHQENADKAFQIINGNPIPGRYPNRLAKRVQRIYDVLKAASKDQSRLKTIDLYVELNRTKAENMRIFDVLRNSIKEQISISKAAIRSGVFSSGVYQANTRISELHKLRIKLSEEK